MAYGDRTQEDSQLPALRLLRAVQFEMDGMRCPLVLPRGVYLPDSWTQMLICGLLQHLARHPATRLMVEVGTGSGVVPIILGLSDLPTGSLRYIGLDVNDVACETARLNVQLNRCGLMSSFIPSGHLLARLPAGVHGSVDLLAANLPQVPDAGNTRRDRNDYYVPRPRQAGLPRRFEQCGTGLLFDLLIGSRSVLSSSGALVLTVAGRCGTAELSSLFTYCDMTYDVLHHAVVRQDPDTSIEHFHKTEETSDIRFEFYSDEAGRNPISARRAAQAASQGLPIYHDLYVMVARHAEAAHQG